MDYEYFLRICCSYQNRQIDIVSVHQNLGKSISVFCRYMVDLVFYYKQNISEPATGGVLQEKVFLEILQHSQENTCARVSFFNKVAGLRPATLLKKRF